MKLCLTKSPSSICTLYCRLTFGQSPEVFRDIVSAFEAESRTTYHNTKRCSPYLRNRPRQKHILQCASPLLRFVIIRSEQLYTTTPEIPRSAGKTQRTPAEDLACVLNSYCIVVNRQPSPVDMPLRALVHICNANQLKIRHPTHNMPARGDFVHYALSLLGVTNEALYLFWTIASGLFGW